MTSDLLFTTAQPRSDAEASSSVALVGLTKVTMDRILREPKPADLLALYSFCCYTSTWQKTQTVKCTAEYMSKGLKWSLSKVHRIRRRLIDLGLLENVPRKGPDGRIIKWYVRVRYVIQNAKIPEGGEPTPKCFQTDKEKCYRRLHKGSSFDERVVPYPTEAEYNDFLERYNIPAEYDGGFFAQMTVSGWRINGAPIKDWRKVLLARVAKIDPNGFPAEDCWNEIEADDCPI